jgi:hypothetical protein
MRLPFVFVLAAGLLHAAPNFAGRMDRPLRYRPEGEDFVIENGAEFFNRPLYGGNTAFRVDGGDKPEFTLYLPGRGGNLRLGLSTPAGKKWLHEAAQMVMRYRPGELLYEIRDPLLGAGGVLRLAVLAYHQTEGLIVRVDAEGVGSDTELVWAYGGANGERGRRDGDIGTENVPISQWFQLKPEFCRGNRFDLMPAGFTLRAKTATIVGVVSSVEKPVLADAAHWNDLPALVASVGTDPGQPVVVGRAQLSVRQPFFLSLQRLAEETVAVELDTYREVKSETGAPAKPVARLNLAPAYRAEELPRRFTETEQYFTALRRRVSVETPDAFLNAAVGALNIAGEAVWDEPQQAIMHGAIAWRTKLLGWRGPYLLDELGWHDRARQHFTDWAAHQNLTPIADRLPAPEEKTNLARNETGLHSNGDLSHSHYDMNTVYIDALFRHLRWTGDLAFAKKIWPVIERHLAWERRLFRREFGPEKLPLYEAYAVIWASDDLSYNGGGAMHASAYNYFHNTEAARLARLIGADPAPYEREAQLLARGMREFLWLPEQGAFAEAKDLLGLQRVHPAAALWTFYHTVDSGVPTPQEAWRMTQQVDGEIPHLPVRGQGVPEGLYTLGTSNWMPYTWSINNVVMAEALHAALGYWQAGRPDEAWKITKGSLLAAMFLGISPGNVGSMSYLDAYRGESQRDFADGSGVLSRALIEGLFGVRPDALAGELRFEPGWPTAWDRASLRHPDFSVEFRRTGDTDTYQIIGAAGLALRLRLVALRDRVGVVMVDGAKTAWHEVEDSIGLPRIEIQAPAAAAHRVTVVWAGNVPSAQAAGGGFVRVTQGEMSWWQPPVARKDAPGTSLAAGPPSGGKFETVDLAAVFNDRVTEIFKHEYRSPRSPFVSLALPKQGLGAWAGGVNEAAEIDDAGLRAASEKGGGRITLPNGVPFATPARADEKNILFTSQWDNFPREAVVPLTGRARHLSLLVAGSTNPMQSRFENGEIVVTYTDGSTDRLALVNPINWWPIEQDYLIDDYQFRRPEPLPVRVNLKSGEVRVLDHATFDGRGGKVPGGAATVLELALQPDKELRSLTVRATANEVVIGLMAATLAR